MTIPRISVSVKEAAETLGVSTDHVHDLKNHGDLEWSKSGSRVLIGYASLIAYYESNRRSA